MERKAFMFNFRHFKGLKIQFKVINKVCKCVHQRWSVPYQCKALYYALSVATIPPV